MAMAMAMRRAGRAGALMRGAEFWGNGATGSARCMASVARVEDERSSSSGRALGAFGALLGAGALYGSCQGMINSEPAAAEEAGPKSALNPKEFVKFKLAEVHDVNHNTKVYRFTFDSQEALGLNVASCLITKAEIGKKKDGSPNYVIRPYTPISPPDSKGYFDLLIKIYPEGKMTQHLAHLKPGDELDVKGPIPKLPYTPNMKKQIGMVAGGTGITPMLQVIDAIVSNPEDNTQVSLVFANTSPADILLKAKLDALSFAHPNFKVFYVVDKSSEEWKGGKGYLNKDMLVKGLPAPSDDTLILVCGPPGMMNIVSGDKAPDRSQGELVGILKDLGYTSEQVFKF
ncbi:hypothetical protein KC19_4G139000 [Ceratodon purpureus]|uniref:cytochrome-b5 reductase n=1 Tax=Ceratodon purpureus TaxID=3225 RepID=A0A8T0I8F3_CERPU|nr:hypothetical protein KC19_4G139000 [Ceratodon purpureus]